MPWSPNNAYYSSAFGKNAQQLGYVLPKMAANESTTTSFVRSSQAAKYRAASLFLPARRWAVAGDVCASANKEVLVLLPQKTRANVLKPGLLRFTDDFAVDSVASTLGFAPAGKISWTVPHCLGSFLYYFADATNISVPKWQTKSSIWGLCGYSLSVVVYALVFSRYVEEFGDVGMNQAFVKVV